MLTGPAELLETSRRLSLHGISRDAWHRGQQEQDPWFYEVTDAGFKYNMSDIEAAIGIAQLPKIEAFGKRRAEIAARYNEAFSQLEALQIPTHKSNVDHAWHVYALRLNGGNRSEFIAELRKRNIAASVHFIPIHLHPYYRDKYRYKPDDFPIAYREYQRLVSLPIYPAMQDRDVEDVIDAVSEIVL
jgi:dTDP-4-amino-4,6-dideoxygalactose transaminase